MTGLPHTKRYRGLDYVLLRASPEAAMYAGYKPRTDAIPQGLLLSYEVFRVRQEPLRTRKVGGKTVTFGGKPKWPGDEAFGSWAWCYRSREKALAKYNSLTST